MEWFSAIFCLFFSWVIFAIARHFWKAPDRWRDQGHLSNGLGYTISSSDDPKSFERMIVLTRLWAGIAFAFSGITFLLGLGWLWRAL
jgi:hypothetical protein